MISTKTVYRVGEGEDEDEDSPEALKNVIVSVTIFAVKKRNDNLNYSINEIKMRESQDKEQVLSLESAIWTKQYLCQHPCISGLKLKLKASLINIFININCSYKEKLVMVITFEVEW